MKEYKYTINGNKYEVVVGDITDNIATLTVNGEEYTVEMEKEPEPEKPKPVVRPVVPSRPRQVDRNALKAPLPGVITDIKVKEGDEVKEGDTLVVLEAMKMDNNLTAERDGKVTAVCVNVGETVMENDDLVVLE
ncbi:MAG: acetyl-CoA carboxylase biotin carboxyl carrier protein subunit [Prevotella sp.]|nr:acetyl-CoA carboxylase biotin carboxyl carrier protein subunit [Prevotella sp.]